MCLFLAELGLCWCTGFYSVGGSSLVAGFSLLWLLSLQSAGSRARGRGSAAHGLGGGRSQAPKHRLSSSGQQASLLYGMWALPGSGITPMSPAIGGRTLNHWAPREVHPWRFKWTKVPHTCKLWDLSCKLSLGSRLGFLLLHFRTVPCWKWAWYSPKADCRLRGLINKIAIGRSLGLDLLTLSWWGSLWLTWNHTAFPRRF